MTIRAAGRNIIIAALASTLLGPAATAPQSPGPLEPLPGQTATLLSDGRVLLLGGEGPSGPLSTAELVDPRTGAATPVLPGLDVPRAGHSATVLPDGTVWVFGGVGPGGRLVTDAQIFDPATLSLRSVATPGLTPRSSHTATLLTEGHVLIAGGTDGQTALMPDAQRWDPVAQALVGVPTPLLTPRQRQTATLLPDGAVLLWGGVDGAGVALLDGERYDPTRSRIDPAPTFPPEAQVSGTPPRLEASVPAAGAIAVRPDSRFVLRFSVPLEVNTLTATTVTLEGPAGFADVQIVPAEGGRLAFITPRIPLQPNAAYMLTLNGPADPAGHLLPATTVPFTTRGKVSAMGPLQGGAPGGPDTASPTRATAAGATAGTETAGAVSGATGTQEPDDEWAWKGEYRDGRPYSPWQGLAPLQAPDGVTALAGQVLRLNGEPLADVTLELSRESGMRRVRTQTDARGQFLLRDVPAGHRELLVDGRRAGRPGRPYGVFEVGVDVTAGRTTILPFTIWLPRIDTQYAVPLPTDLPDGLVITTPRVPGLEVRLPAGSVIRNHEGRIAREISITPIPRDRPPFPLLDNVTTPVYFTIQPGAGYVYSPTGAGARVIYPNFTGDRREPPGTEFHFWHYDPEGPGWQVYGPGAVTADARQVVPDPGVEVYEFTGAMAGPPALGCCTAPAQGAGGGPAVGEPVDAATGLFVLQKTDLVLPDVLPLALTRTYQPGDSVSRAFGIAATHPYDIFLWSATPYTEVDLILPNGRRIHFVRTTPDTGFTGAQFEHTSSDTEYFKARIIWNGSAWQLTLRDGRILLFPPNARLQSLTDRFGNAVTLTRAGGPTGDLTEIRGPSGRFFQLAYDASRRITQARDNLGRIVSYTYDSSGRLTSVTDPAGGVTTYTYDAAGRMATLTDARGITFLTNEYNTGGRVVRQAQADGTTFQFAYALDGNGKVVQTDVTDPRGFVERLTFSGSGYLLSETRALGRPEQQTITYERQTGTNLVTAVVDPLGRRTEYAYDALGNVTSVTRLARTAQAVSTTYAYDPTFSVLTSVTDPLNHTASFGYDSRGALTSATDPLNHRITLAVNGAGQPKAITDSLNQTTQLGYDGSDLRTITDPLGNQVVRIVDAGGRLAQTTDPLGRPTHFVYDPLNQPVQTMDPGAGVTRFAYDSNGNLLSLTDARGNTTSYAYDVMDRVATRTDALGHKETYQYDANGNLIGFTDRKGQLTTFTYDALNRRTQARYADGSTTSYSYDAGNRLTQVTDSVSGTITHSHDGLDRLTQEITPRGTVSYTYDAAGRRSTMTVAGQPTVSYTYDNADRLTQLTQGAATVAFAYDSANRRTSLTLPNGVVVASGYDAASRLTALTYTWGSTLLGTLAYGYDAAGQRVLLGGTWARTSLPPVTGSASYNADNQQLALGARTMTYDGNGNLTTLTEGAGATVFVWDPRDRLTGLTGPSVTATFGYDALGRRWTKTVNGTRTDFVYDGLNPVQELNGTSVTANLLTGLGVDEYFTRGTSTLVPDALGSTVALTDLSGTATTQYTYEPFGSTTSAGSASTNPFQYTGRENDATGLYHYRARYYHPGLQRFISEDPAEFGGGDVDLYAYVWGNPTTLVDPLGLWSVTICAAAGFGGCFTGGKDLAGWFTEGILGVAKGFQVSLDPRGEWSGPQCAQGYIGLGLRGGASLRRGPLSVSGAVTVRGIIGVDRRLRLSGGPQTNGSIGTSISPSGGFGIGGSASAGVVFGFSGRKDCAPEALILR